MSTFLNCDRLVSNACTIGDYVIEWRLGSTTGTIVFVSGEGSDPAIQAQHPLVDEVVFAGTLYPIIRYVYINGSKYTAYYEAGAYYSPDFITCLSPVVIDAIDCSTVIGTDPLYSYKLAYVNATDLGTDKSRSIKYNISSTTKYFAWDFLAKDVAEQLLIYYCTAIDPVGTLVDNFIMGTRNSSGGTLVTNLYPASYPTNPRIYNFNYYQSTKFITDLTGFAYSTGDYLKIKVIGSVLEPAITNTDWTLKLQCFEIGDIDCSFYDTSINKITSTPAMAYTSDPSCNYNISYNTTTAPGIQSKTTSPYFIYKYLHVNTTSLYNPVTNGNFTNPVNSSHNWKSTQAMEWVWNGVGVYTCTNLSVGQTINMSKTSTEYTFTFTDIVDYNKFVSNILSVQASAKYSQYLTSTPADLNYYGYYYIRWVYATSCGDAQTIVALSFHFASTITYDSVAKTIKFLCYIPTNGIADTACDETYEGAANAINSCTITKNFTISPSIATTHVRSIDPIGALRPYLILQYNTTITHYEYFYIHDVLLNGICNLSTDFCLDGTSHEWRLYRSWDRTTLTDITSHETRLGNWTLERKMFLRIDNCADINTWETVYTEITPTSTTTTTTTSIPITTTTSTTTLPTTTTSTTTSTPTTTTSTTSSSTSTTTTTVFAGHTYYLAPAIDGGNDSNNGSILHPFFTINKAWSVVVAGDLIYMRGGTYLYNSWQFLENKSGTAGNLIKIWAYPGEIPIITKGSSWSSNYWVGVFLRNVNYIHLKGLEIKGFTQLATGVYSGLRCENVNSCILESLNVHHNGQGIEVTGNSAGNLVLNCDAHHNQDPIDNYENADGIQFFTVTASSGTNTVRGCRAWWNTDDGFDAYASDCKMVYEDCWSFWNGYIPDSFTSAGNGNGFKIGPSSSFPTTTKRVYTNCVAFRNGTEGFNSNDILGKVECYNNTAYLNGTRGFAIGYQTVAHIVKNNLAYQNGDLNLCSSYSMVDHNTFLYNGNNNSSYSVGSNDFVSLTSTGIDGARQSDDSLPVITFLHLVNGSDLVNSGVDVGLPYNNSAPDLGAFESNY